MKEPWRDGEADEVSAILNEVPQVDPPSTLVNTVMSTIASRTQAQATHSPQIFMKRGSTMAKKALWIVAAAAAAALIVMRLVGYPPVEKGTEATIGAAQRYQAPQISSADVKTQDGQLQAFLQSDLFRQLAADKAAQQALKNKDFQRALKEPGVRAVLANSEVRSELLRAAPNGLVNNEALQLVMSKNELFRVALDASPLLRAALLSPGVVAAMSTRSLDAALSRADVAIFLTNEAAIGAILQASSASIDAAGVSTGAAAGVRTEVKTDATAAAR